VRPSYTSGRPYFYMCRSARSSTNKCGIDHVDLSLYEQLFGCSGRAVNACATTISSERGSVYAQNCLPYLLRHRRSQNLRRGYHSNYRSSKHHNLSNKTFFHLYPGFEGLSGVALRSSVCACLHGVHRQVLDSRLQHPGTFLPDHPGTSQVCQGDPRQED